MAIETGRSPGTAVALGIRPEAFKPATPGGPYALAGRLRLVEHLGSDLYIHLDWPGQDRPVIARLDAERAPHVAIGDDVELAVHPDRVLLFSPDGQRIRSPNDLRPAIGLADEMVATAPEYVP
jgi:multiple sugar transport system ATP-binding protein